MRLLVVDDDVEVRDLLVRALERDGHSVHAVTTAADARRILREQTIDVIVLDLALPDQSGVDLCTELRAELDPVPVLILTAHNDVSERVRALDAGADDFLAKPFAVVELRARVRALGRRRERRWSAPRVTLNGLHIDFAGRQVHKGAQRIELTAREWTILEALAGDAGEVVPRAYLLREGWGAVNDANAASLEVLVGRIRRKLGTGIIRTVRGLGYSLGAP